jgi:DNA (cytosine-5)-methyltransferase 1
MEVARGVGMRIISKHHTSGKKSAHVFKSVIMHSVELFAGAGGLAIGLHEAGFRPLAVVERDRHSCETLRCNATGRNALLKGWPIEEADVMKFDFSAFVKQADLVSGGPPCQPFSIGGKHRGFTDHRDMFPEAVRIVRLLQPRAFIFENVRGLLRRSFARYFQYIILQLTYPDIARHKSENWEGHLQRLELHHTQGHYAEPYYRVVFRLVNAADYGVPQRRERVVIVGFRNDVQENWSFPEPTHSAAALLHSQFVSGDYWERHAIGKNDRAEAPVNLERRISLFDADGKRPWQTVRDAIADLPDPLKPNEIINHRFQPGARIYPGHCGSRLDEPAKTLKAGDHGVPGGENMMVMEDGSVRYFTVRESARLQTFPDSFVFATSWTESMRQIGNAVPVTLAKAIGESVASALQRHRVREQQGRYGRKRAV